MLTTLEKALALRETPLFEGLEADALLPLATLCTEVDLDTGDVLFEQGEWGDAMYIVVRGTVAVERDAERIATLTVGECVGEMAAIDWEPRSATIQASEPTVLIAVDRHDLLDLLGDHVALADNLARVLVARLRSTATPG